MTVQIYTFSGTGNSLHVARELQRRLPGATVLPMVGALRDGRLASEAEVIGLVFPIHAMTLPALVRRFLERVDLRSAEYVFAVSTRLCWDKVFADVDSILARKGKALDAAFAVETPCNYIPIFTLPSQEEMAEMEEKLERNLEAIQSAVTERRPSRETQGVILSLLGRAISAVVAFWFRSVRFPNMERSFHADARCTGCGVCERVCLAERIRIQDGRPVWVDDVPCTHCFACLHYCPMQAVQIRGRKTQAKGRYHHPTVNANDIAGQKRWGP